MSLVALVAGAILLTVVLLDAFQTIILPRRPVGRIRITRAFIVRPGSPGEGWPTVCALVHGASIF